MDKQKVRSAIKKQKTTLEKVTKRIGVSLTTGSQWMNNVKQPTKKHLKDFCKILNITPAELYGGVSQEDYQKEKEFTRTVIITGTVQAAGKIVSRKKQTANLPKELSVKKSKSVICIGNSMRPLCENGDLILYNEDLKVKDNDLVIVEIKNYGKFFKKFKNLSLKDTQTLTKKMIKKLKSKEYIYMFNSVNPSKKYPSFFCGSNEVISMYKVTGICYR